MLEKWSKMSVREAMIDLVGVPPSHGEQKRWLEAVADKVEDLTYRTARSLWLGEIDEDHRAAKAVKREAARVKAMREAKQDARTVANFFSRRAQALANIDPDFHRSEIDAFLEAARIVSSGDRSGNL